MFERLTPEVRANLAAAALAATERGDPAITPDHLLLALAGSSGLAFELLAEASVDRAAVEAAMPPAPGGTGSKNPPFTAPAKKALELALRESLNLAHAHIGSGHLLLGLLRLGESEGTSLLPATCLTLDGVRAAVRERSEGPRLGGRRRPRRTGRIIEAMTVHEQMKAAQAQAASAAGEGGRDEDTAVRVATEEGTRLQRALASLGVSPQELQDALAEVAEPVEDGPVEIVLGGGATLTVTAGDRAADLRSLLAAADHVQVETHDGTVRVLAPALGDAVFATLEGWLTA